MTATVKAAPTRAVETVDPVWQRICEEARAAIDLEPAFGGFLHATILDQPRLEEAVVQRVADRLGNGAVTSTMIRRAYAEALENYLADNCNAWALRPDGIYERVQAADGEPAHSAQMALLGRICG